MSRASGSTDRRDRLRRARLVVDPRPVYRVFRPSTPCSTSVAGERWCSRSRRRTPGPTTRPDHRVGHGRVAARARPAWIRQSPRLPSPRCRILTWPPPWPESPPPSQVAARAVPGQVRWPGPSAPPSPVATTSWCRPAPAPASRSPTSCRPSCAAGESWSPPPPRRCRTSWPARTCRSSPTTSAGTFSFAVLKGRSNYVCRQRLDEISGDGQLALDGLAERASPRSSRCLADLGRRHRPPATAPSCRRAIAPGVGGGQRLVAGVPRRRNAARRAARASPSRPGTRAADADVVVVNTHLLRPRPRQPAARCCPSTTWS